MTDQFMVEQYSGYVAKETGVVSRCTALGPPCSGL